MNLVILIDISLKNVLKGPIYGNWILNNKYEHLIIRAISL